MSELTERQWDELRKSTVERIMDMNETEAKEELEEYIFEEMSNKPKEYLLECGWITEEEVWAYQM